MERAQADLVFAFARDRNCCGISVVERSTPERSAPVRSVSRRMVTPISAPENFAPFTLAWRKFALRSKRTLKICVGKIAAKKLDAAGLRFFQIRARKNCLGHIRIAQIGFAQIGAGQVRARQLRFAQVGAFQICVLQKSRR